MAFPDTTQLDDFSGSLSNWGANVESGYPSMSIAAGRLGPTAAFQSNYWLTPFARDQEVWVTIPVLPAASSVRVIARLNNPGSSHAYYHVTVYNDGSCYLEYTSGGSPTNLQTLGSAGTVAAGNKIGLRCIGSTLQAFRDSGSGWAQLGSDTTDTRITTGGYLALQAYNDATAVARFDAFGGGGFTPGLAYPRTFDSLYRGRAGSSSPSFSTMPKAKLRRG